MRRGHPWMITYKGWRITHDPLGHLACYRLAGRELYWCYPASTVEGIKNEIDRREDLLQRLRELDA